jgi:hypothetical protein
MDRNIWVNKFENLILPILIGIIFFQIVVGYEVLNPQNLSWIFGRFDPPQHYLGWVFYRASPWQFPIGASPYFGMDISSSIVFTDSIPLMAIIFKIASSMLPKDYQYIGIWLLICFVLQSYFAWKILSLISNNYWIKLFGTGLLAFAPPMLWRLSTPSGTQAALAAHFLILAAIFLALCKEPRKINFSWIILLCVSLLTHFYLFFMVGMIWISDLLDRVLCQKTKSFKYAIAEIAIAFLLVFLCAWQAGYFLIRASSGVESGYGFFKLNLLSPFDPNGWSYFLPTIPIPTTWGEGFNYLGLGAIFLLALSLISLLFGMSKSEYRAKINLLRVISRHIFLIACLFFLYLDALTNNIGIGMLEVKYDIPSFLYAPLNVLRSSARMYWPIHYSLVIASIYIVYKVFPRNVVITLLGATLLMQVIDTKNGWTSIRQSLRQDVQLGNYSQDLKDQFWRNAALHYKKIILIPAKSQSAKWVQFASLAAQNNMQTNSVYFARTDDKKVELANRSLLQIIKDGAYDSESLYIFEERFLIPILATAQPNDLVAKVDEFYVLAPKYKECAECKQPSVNHLLSLNSLAPSMGVSFGFSTKAEDKFSPFYLGGGWSWQESWGVWSDGSNALLNLSWPNIKPNSISLIYKAFVVSQSHPALTINVYVNGVFNSQITTSNFDNNKITIPITDEMLKSKFLSIEFKLANPKAPVALMAENSDKRLLGIGLVSAQYLH